ncbi:TIM44-like domain-containing protein [Lactococcus garvieae]|uniref:TIM44-like domain-containing protein n=1 Tax=Lactococcus garvieae TaxID=1363 RepID=UPI0038532423
MIKKQKIFIALLVIVFFLTFAPHVLALAGGLHGGGVTGGGGFHGGNGSVHTSNHATSSIEGGVSNKVMLMLSLVGLGIIIAISAVIKPKVIYTEGVHIEDIQLANAIKKQFLSIQNAWNTQDISRVSQLYSEKLYAKHTKILLNYLDKRKINHTENIEIEGLSRLYWKKSNTFEIDISFKAIDYVIDKDTQHILKGLPNAQQKFKQRWTFVIDVEGMKVDKIKEFRI